jgi:hypothetical protein
MNMPRNQPAHTKSRKHQPRAATRKRARREEWLSMGAQFLLSVTSGARFSEESPTPLGIHFFRL